jgi:hypothetical protein
VRDTPFLSGSEPPARFSERLSAFVDDMPWTLENLVTAQQMDCQLVPRDEIARQLGRRLEDVNRKLDGSGEPPRQTRAGVGFSSMKGR